METDVIKSFLVGLGFGVDDASLAKFNKAITSASAKVAAMYAGIQAAAAGIFYGISKMSQGFEDIGYELRLVAPAINKMLILRQAMLDAYRRAGINLTKVVQQSILFNYSLAKTKFALDAVWKSVGAKFLPLLTKQMDIFRQKIFANMPKIQEYLTKFVDFIFKAFHATVQLGTTLWSILGRVYDFLKELDTVTGGWSTKILLAAAAWKLLNLEFLATPLGMILTGLLAILALYDDFKVWQEGGKSFFDWAHFVPVINAVKNALSDVSDVIGSLMRVVWGLVDAIVQLLTLDFKSLKYTLENIFGDLGESISKFLGRFKDIANIGGYLQNWAVATFGGSGAAANMANVAQPQPLVNQPNGANQKVNQETNIIVQGSSDANAVGKSVANEQNKVNFDMTRNLKGAMR